MWIYMYIQYRTALHREWSVSYKQEAFRKGFSYKQEASKATLLGYSMLRVGPTSPGLACALNMPEGQ